MFIPGTSLSRAHMVFQPISRLEGKEADRTGKVIYKTACVETCLYLLETLLDFSGSRRRWQYIHLVWSLTLRPAALGD